MLSCLKKNFLGLMLELGMIGFLGTAIVLAMATTYHPTFNENPWLAAFVISDVVVLACLALSQRQRIVTDIFEHIGRPTLGATGVLMTWLFIGLLHERAGLRVSEIIPPLIFCGLMALLGIMGFVAFSVEGAKQVHQHFTCSQK